MGRLANGGAALLVLLLAVLLAPRGRTQVGEWIAAPLSAPVRELPEKAPAQAAPPPAPAPVPAPVVRGLCLAELIDLALARNPSLQQAVLEIESARGKALQAGLYPNPTFLYSADEIGDRTGPAGIHTPAFTQEIVTAGKLRLSRAVAQRDVDLATLALVRQRYVLLTGVRQGYFEVLTTRRRFEVLDELERVAKQSLDNAKKLLDAGEISRLDVLTFEVERERLLARRDAARREADAAWGRLVATMGVFDLPPAPVQGSVDAPLPDYDLERARAQALAVHPEVRAAEVGVHKAQLAVARARVEPIPNITLGAGYTYQGQNRSNDGMVQLSLPIPLWNRNEGNRQAAQAELARAQWEIDRVRNDLSNRLWTAFGAYTSARTRAERLQRAILPRARETFDLARKGYQGGQFEYLRVLQAQRAIQEANLEYLEARAEAWKAACEIAGLLQEEAWPWPGCPAP